MSRFTHLEFGSDHEGEQSNESLGRPPKKASLVKDEAHYFAEAQAAFASGQFGRALRHFAKVLEYNPHNGAAWAGQVRMLIELNELGEANLWADKALERFPDHPELLAAKGVALARRGDLKAALAYSDAAISEGDDTPYVWLARGDVQLAGNEKRADYCFEKALSLAPRDWFCRWLAARVHFYYEKLAAALRFVQEALALNAAQGVLWLLLGRCQRGLGLIDQAKTSFQQARELLTETAEADEALRELYRLGFWDRLTQRWRRFVAG